MSPQGIGSIGTTHTNSAKPTTKNFNDLQSEDFFGLLIAQLQSQDPLKPTDNQTLLNQMSSIRQMEQSSTLTKTLNSLAAEQRFGSASSLIGHYVAGQVQDSNGNNVDLQGVVTGVRFESSGRAILELHNGKEIPADKVDQVTLVENLPADIRQQLGLDGTTPGGTTTQRTVLPDAGTAAKASVKQPAADDGLVGSVLRSLFGTGGSVGMSV